LQWQSQRDGIVIEKDPHIDTTGGTAVVVMDEHVIAAGMQDAQKITDSNSTDTDTSARIFTTFFE
jgi:hypothetical protein